MNARSMGAGEPLVLIHGAGTSHEVWRRVLPGLARKHRAIAVDLPGYGASPPAGAGFDLAEVADRVVQGLGEHGVTGPFDLVGHSLGGAVAILVAHRHPERVRRLVLLAPAGLAAVPWPASALLALAAAPFARARRWFGAPLAGLPLARRVWLAGLARDGARVPAADARAVIRCSAPARRLGPGLAAAARADLRPELAGLEVPVGLIWGAEDPVVPPSRIARVIELHPDLPVRIVPSSAHAPQLEHPDEFCEALSEVLGRLSPGR